MSSSDQLKRCAGERAAELVTDGQLVGLGTGSTAVHAVRRLGVRVREQGLSVRGIPTSKATEAEALAAGIPLVELDAGARPDLTIDGADEIDPGFDMIKGGGGALLREKVVAHRSRRLVIVVDPSKRVERLGVAFALPVEVVPFAWKAVASELEELGASVRLRRRDGGEWLSDNGNCILDASFPGIGDAAAMAQRLDAIPGVVANGLFVGMADLLVVGTVDGAQLFERPRS